MEKFTLPPKTRCATFVFEFDEDGALALPIEVILRDYIGPALGRLGFKSTSSLKPLGLQSGPPGYAAVFDKQPEIPDHTRQQAAEAEKVIEELQEKIKGMKVRLLP